VATPRPASSPEAGTWRQITWLGKSLPGGLPAGFESSVRSYLAELARWARVTHLTGYEDPGARLRHLVLDSLLVLQALPPGIEGPLLDIGSGAGAPGLVLKLARPAWQVDLVEANRRRANFLRQALRRVGAEECTVHQERAEVLAGHPTQQGRFRIVTLRAVAEPSVAVRLATPFMAPQGVVVVALGTGRQPTPPGRVRVVRVPRQGSAGALERRLLIVGPLD
jgi:16S rRNA (guanine527-N7)-methyltransferase